MNIIRHSHEVKFTLEIKLVSNGSYDIRLTNTYNLFCYIPSTEMSKTIIDSILSKNEFSIQNIYELDNPVVIIDGYKNKFKRDISRIELEREI